MVSRKREFCKTYRLSKPSEFNYVFKSKKRSIDSQFLVLAAHNKLNCARLGLAISRKNVPSAVKRNKVKRIIRESFRKRQTDLIGFDIVVVSQKKIVSSDNKKLSDSLEKHWKQLIK